MHMYVFVARHMAHLFHAISDMATRMHLLAMAPQAQTGTTGALTC